MNRQIVSIFTVLSIAGGAIYGCDQADIEDGIASMFRGTPEFVPENDEANCLDRQGEVVGSGGAPASMRGFVPDALRWAAADVGPSTRAGHQGVNTVGNDERGQEYVEYYTVITPQLVDESLDAKPVALGQLEEGGRSVSENALPEDVARALEDAEDGEKTVGACIFHSWHADIEAPLPACEGEGGCLEQAPTDGSDSNFPYAEYGVPLELTPENFRMKVSFNSNRAAADLVEQCFRGTNGNGDPIVPEFEDGGNTEDPFFRGCMGAANLFGTEWRRSDPSVCAAANRLRECGCAIPGLTDGLSLPAAAKAVGDAVVPPEGNAGWYRGFKLGSWLNSDARELSTTPLEERLTLPAGCRYVNIGEDSKTIVACRLTVDDFLEDVDNPKETCREKYGMDVVVHVPVPGSAIECTPDGSEANKSCGAMPWNIGFEGEAEEKGEAPAGEDCFKARSDGGCSDDAITTCVCESGEGRFADKGCCDSKWDTKCVSEAEACAAPAA
jgi:hypothetical protein